MALFEHFNTSNQTSPHFEKHENFVISLNSPGCALVETLNYEDRCAFIRKTEECRDSIIFFDYTNIYYCIFRPYSGYQAFACLVCFGFFVLMLMNCVGIITDRFFCPPLKYITDKMGISENLAGITLLSFGNSAPDLVSNLVSAHEEQTTLFSDSVGSAIFITAGIAGSIIAMRPFHVEGPGFVRDIAFHMLAITYIDYAIKSNRYVTMLECIVVFSLYPIYFIIIILDEYFLVQTIKSLRAELADPDSLREMYKRRQIDAGDDIFEKKKKRLRKLKREAEMSIEIRPKMRTIPGTSTNPETTDANELLIWQLLDTLMPFSLEEWGEAGWFKRTWLVIQAPINVILSILIPEVDLDLELSGWSKLLNCIHLPLLPALICNILGHDVILFGYTLPIFTLFITVPLALITFCVTRTDRPPPFHILYGIFSITGSIILIRCFTKELVNIITVVGMVTFVSQSFLGCTIEAWGNSIGDLIASVELAKQGYQKMGLASCIAGPLFYLTLGLGCVYFYKCIVNNKTYTYEATQGSMGENSTIFLMLTLCALLCSGLMTNFHLRRSIGVFILLQYMLFCLYCLLGEFQFIHPYGTDHTEDYGIAFM